MDLTVLGEDRIQRVVNTIDKLYSQERGILTHDELGDILSMVFAMYILNDTKVSSKLRDSFFKLNAIRKEMDYKFVLESETETSYYIKPVSEDATVDEFCHYISDMVKQEKLPYESKITIKIKGLTEEEDLTLYMNGDYFLKTSEWKFYSSSPVYKNFIISSIIGFKETNAGTYILYVYEKERPKITNFERIKKMNEEEFLCFLRHCDTGAVYPVIEGNRLYTHDEMIQWLRKEVDA